MWIHLLYDHNSKDILTWYECSPINDKYVITLCVSLIYTDIDSHGYVGMWIQQCIQEWFLQVDILLSFYWADCE